MTTATTPTAPTFATDGPQTVISGVRFHIRQSCPRCLHYVKDVWSEGGIIRCGLRSTSAGWRWFNEETPGRWPTTIEPCYNCGHEQPYRLGTEVAGSCRYDAFMLVSMTWDRIRTHAEYQSMVRQADLAAGIALASAVLPSAAPVKAATPRELRDFVRQLAMMQPGDVNVDALLAQAREIADRIVDGRRTRVERRTP